MMPRALAALLLACAGAGTARAGDAPSIRGSWTGTIGNSSANVCFDPGFSSYFYLSHLHGIRLEEAEEPNSWNESPRDVKRDKLITTGKWKIASIGSDHAEGEWLGTGKTTSLPIQLTRSGDECGEDFLAPLAASIDRSYRDEKIGNVALRITTSRFGKNFELTGSGDAIGKINAFTANWESERLRRAYDCTVGGGEWQSSLTVRNVLGNYLQAQYDVPSVDCGGLRLVHEHSTLMFDLRTGEQVGTGIWLSARDPIDAGLRAMIMKKADPCEDSNPAISPANPTATGLVFDIYYTPYFRSCNTSVEISYAKLAPFLSKEGKALTQSIRSLSGRL